MAFSFPTITQTESRYFDLPQCFLLQEQISLIFVSFAEMSLRYAILCSIIVDILDGSAYLFDKEAPERISASERLAHIEELIASVEKDGVEGIQTEVDKNSLNDG